ncbi:MAG TPA: ATP-binding protein [Thermodesulfovibrionales bacterium]|nr:ATP-binding protein [Thermodesulfovibrionales bacterium]
MKETLLFISILLFLGLFFLSLVFLAMARVRRAREVMKREDGSQVGFIVDTFHELVARLKEKEKELETLRKKAEERADVFQSYNEYILQSVPSGVISLDGDLVVTKVNSAAERILEVKAEDARGRPCDDVFREPLTGLLKGKTFAGREEFLYRTTSGRKLHIGFTLTPLKNAESETIGQLLVFTDLTELKALQSQAELRDRLSSLGEMAAGMAHELRNPMAVIAGYTKLLSKKIDPSMIPILESVSHEIGVMDRIIADFLSFAKPTELQVSAVDLSQLIKNCVMHIAPAHQEIRVSLGIDGMPLVLGDEIQLRQAFTNLIQNAVEAMPTGGELNFGFSADGDSVEITISDTGHGIPEEIRNKVFLPFYTTKDRGTGLGLAIVHKIVVSHRGAVSVESGEKGASFRVRLPLVNDRQGMTDRLSRDPLPSQ